MDDTKLIKPKPAPPPDTGLTLVFKQEWAQPDGRCRTIGLILSVLVLTALYWENLKHFTFVWSNDDNYSHGWLVIPLCVFFANQAAQKRSVKQAIPDRSTGLRTGPVLIMAGLSGRLVTVFLPIGLVADSSLIVCLAGVVALIYGTGTLKKYAFPIGFLVFMIPLPVALYTMLANPLQLVVSKVASMAMTFAGIPVHAPAHGLSGPDCRSGLSQWQAHLVSHHFDRQRHPRCHGGQHRTRDRNRHGHVPHRPQLCQGRMAHH